LHSIREGKRRGGSTWWCSWPAKRPRKASAPGLGGGGGGGPTVVWEREGSERERDRRREGGVVSGRKGKQTAEKKNRTGFLWAVFQFL
jgi:hypothetical protein